jgi:hypothetical protein
LQSQFQEWKQQQLICKQINKLPKSANNKSSNALDLSWKQVSFKQGMSVPTPFNVIVSCKW